MFCGCKLTKYVPTSTYYSCSGKKSTYAYCMHTMRFPLPIRTEGRSCAVVPEVKIHLRRCSGNRIGASTASLRPLQAQNGILHNKMTVDPIEEMTMQRHIPSVPLHRLARPDKSPACINLFLPNRHNISFT